MTWHLTRRELRKTQGQEKFKLKRLHLTWTVHTQKCLSNLEHVPFLKHNRVDSRTLRHVSTSWTLLCMFRKSWKEADKQWQFTKKGVLSGDGSLSMQLSPFNKHAMNTFHVHAYQLDYIQEHFKYCFFCPKLPFRYKVHSQAQWTSSTVLLCIY